MLSYPPLFNLIYLVFCIALHVLEGDDIKLELSPTDRPANVSFSKLLPEKPVTTTVTAEEDGSSSSKSRVVWESLGNMLAIPNLGGSINAGNQNNNNNNNHIRSISNSGYSKVANNNLEFHQNQWVKIDYHPKLALKFFFTVNPQADVKGLTFIHAYSGQDLHELLYRKFKQDPNVSVYIHKKQFYFHVMIDS